MSNRAVVYVEELMDKVSVCSWPIVAELLPSTCNCENTRTQLEDIASLCSLLGYRHCLTVVFTGIYAVTFFQKNLEPKFTFIPNGQNIFYSQFRCW